MSNGKVKSHITTIHRASVQVPDHLYRRFGHTKEYEQKNIALAASMDASGSNSYAEVEEWAESLDGRLAVQWVIGWERYLAELEVKAVPAGATHYGDTYGERTYYRKRRVDHLNQVSEEWQVLTAWDYWDGDAWVDVGAGFSDRRLKEVGQ